MLVIIGATPEGKKELIGFQVGLRESAQSWHELLTDIKGRGLSTPPKIAVGDGAMGSGTHWTGRSQAQSTNGAGCIR